MNNKVQKCMLRTFDTAKRKSHYLFHEGTVASMQANAKARLSEVVDIAKDSNNSGEKAKRLLSFKSVVLSRISSEWQSVIILAVSDNSGTGKVSMRTSS